jgi:hypothetical protein
MPREWTWVRSDRSSKSSLSKSEKARLLGSAQAFLDEHYKAHIAPPPEKPQFNYVIDYSVKWRGSYIYFISKYACPGPNALSPEFEIAFARIGYFSRGRCNLWARRHNDEWIVLEDDLTLEKCFAEMKTNPWFEG